MPKYVDKVTYTLDLSDKLKDLRPREKKTALNEVGQYLVEQILENCGRGQTSVANGSWKRSLSPKYREVKGDQSSSTFANMELTGAMLDALEYRVNGSKVEVGIFDYDEAQKADNHNKFSSSSQATPVPQRQFIPRPKETFKRDIITEVLNIIEEFKDGKD